VNNIIGSFTFGFKSSRELLRLYSNTNLLIDSVLYSNQSPWPSAPDGGGATLELKNPWLNNDLASNWSASVLHGTPGAENSIFTSVHDDRTISIPRIDEILPNYPNPFNLLTNIEYRIANSGFVSLKVFDILGREVATLVNEVKSPGTYSIRWNASKCTSGMYFYRIEATSIDEPNKKFVETKKMILLK
jgi:hypothetical protein